MEAITARELMSTDLLTVRPSAGLRELVDFLRDNEIHGAMVREGDRLVGVVSYTDLMVYLADERIEAEHAFSHLFAEDGAPSGDELPGDLDRACVSDVMTAHVVTVPPEATAGAVAARMREEGIHRVAVVDAGKAVGLVSATDLLEAVTRYETQGAEVGA